MSRTGRIAVLGGLVLCIAPASAAATETRELTIAEPIARECAAQPLPAGHLGIATETWTAPAEGYLTVRLGGDPYAPDWDLAVFDRSGGPAASTNSGSLERANLWVEAGDEIAIQACRLAGGDESVPLTIDLYEMAIPEPAEERFSLEEVAIDGAEDLERLDAMGLDVTHDVTPEGATVALYSEAERALVEAAGFESETLIRDLAARDEAHLEREAEVEARSALPSARDSYRVYEDYTSEMKQLVAEHPDRARSIVLGTSLEGRPIEGIEIATDVNRTDDGRPVYLNIGMTHAREWPSGEFPMEFAIDLVTRYDSEPRIRSILDRTRTVIAPVVNPDGFIASRTSGTTPNDDLDPVTGGTAGLAASGTGAYRRKNCRGVTPEEQQVPCAARTSGVDLNRNYGAYWGGPGSSTDPASQSYRGPGPFSEPESRAVRDYTSSIHPTVFVTNHTFTDGRWLRQPGFDAPFLPQTEVPTYNPDCDKGTMGAITPDEPAMKQLGDAMAAANEPDWISELAYESLCDITGATEDWNYYSQGTYGYTPEAKGENFHAAYASMVVAEYLGNDGDAGDLDGMQGAFVVAGEEAGDTGNHGVLAGAAPPRATLRLRKEFETPTCESASCTKGNGPSNEDVLESTLTVPDSGSYSWHVNPSSRPDTDDDPDTRTPPPETWTMTCKQQGQERSEPQHVAVDRGQTVTVDWRGLCGAEAGGPDAGGPQQRCRDQIATIVGTAKGETLRGTRKRDVIAARGGGDKIRGRRGKDLVCAGAGADRVHGSASKDELFGNGGPDALFGGPGGDTLIGGGSADELRGGKGRDRCPDAGKRDVERRC